MVELLQKMVQTPSFSGEEDTVVEILIDYLVQRGVEGINRHHNNIWILNRHFDSSKPTILLCSHHDTVKPSAAYTVDPFGGDIVEVDGGRKKLFGLGSNDAGASVVGLSELFLHFYNEQSLNFNLCLALVAEEEISGSRGLKTILEKLPTIDFAIVGEPTEMKMAIAERGLMVVDCEAKGKSGHAARNEGINAIYVAMQDMAWAATYRFDRVSPFFGDVKMTTTIIEAGSAHNVVPDSCRFTVDCRVTEQYTLEEVLQTMRENMSSQLAPRSMRLRPSSISLEHPLVQIGLGMGIEYYGSPTTSDAAVLSPIPTLKMGIGDSARSHTADEYIYVDELERGVEQYVTMVGKLLLD